MTSLNLSIVLVDWFLMFLRFCVVFIAEFLICLSLMRMNDFI